jgi:WD40 repeat protein
MGEEGKISVSDHQVGVVWTPRADGLIIALNLAGDLTYLKEGSEKPLKVVQGHQKNITALTTSSNSKTLWTGSSDGQICSWNLSTGTAECADGETHSNYVSGLTTSSSGHISSVGWDDSLRTLDSSAATFTGGSTATSGQPKGVSTMGEHTIVATHKAIEVFTAGKKTVSLNTTFSATCIAASKDLIAVGTDEQSLRIYTLSSNTLKQTHSIPSLPSQPSALAFSPSGHHLALGLSSGKITVYDTSDWSVAISRWSAHTGKVMSIAWDKEGKRAVSGGLDCSVYVWSVKDQGGRVAVNNAHKDGINGVAWAEGGRVVSVGGDAAVKAWKVEGVE